MSQDMYNAPDSDVNYQTNNQPAVRRSSTTAFGWVVTIMAVLGLLVAGSGIIVAMGMTQGAAPLSNTMLVVDAVLSFVSKIGLLVAGIALIIRASWVLKGVYFGLIVSSVDTLFKAILIIPETAASAGDPTVQMGIFIGFYVVAAISLAAYIGLLFYLKSENSKNEFSLVG